MSKRAYVLFFSALLASKVFLAALFSSDYEARLFTPFLLNGLSATVNPWDAALNAVHELGFPVSPFPYPPVMVAVYLPIAGLLKLLAGSPEWIRNIIFKLPTFAADLSILWFLWVLFPKRRGMVLLVYFASPIVIYACFMHSQLDLVPMSLLLGAIFLLTRDRLIYSALFVVLAAGAKFHVLAALPLILIYLLKNFRPTFAFYYFLIVAGGLTLIVAPFYRSPGFAKYVLENEQQRKILESFYQIGDLRVYLPLLATSVIYLRFLTYRKINTDLLLSYLTMLFLVFIMLISPAPGWFVWVVPFVSAIFIKRGKEDFLNVSIYAALTIGCVAFSIFFFKPEIVDLRFLGYAVQIKVDNPIWRNYGFTALEAILFALLIYVYRYGVKSNTIYKMDQAIVIGIAGDSSTGKSTLLGDIRNLVSRNRLVELEGDGDHKWERGSQEWQEITHLNPKANFLHRQAEQIIALKNHKHIDRTDYDHATGKFTAPQRVVSNDIIVLSGLHAFYLPISRKAIDLKVYLEVEENLRRHWKICRDTRYRDHDISHTMNQIESRMEDARKYIHPQKQFADIVLEYFSDAQFTVGDPGGNPAVRLKIWLNANINLEAILRFLDAKNAHYEHDYDEDLRSQWLVLPAGLDYDELLQHSDEWILNLEELVGGQIEWQKGVRGLVQLIIALNLSLLFQDRQAIHAA